MTTDDDPSRPLDSIAKREAARAMYEATPDVTYAEVAEHFDVGVRTLMRWSSSDGFWEKAGSPKVTARAHALADQIMAEAGPDADNDAKRHAGEVVRIEVAAKERAAVLSRHRTEWAVVRGLTAEAVRARDDGKARLAVNVGRALDLAQRGERRAWGLDASEGGSGGNVIVIERT